MKQAIHSGRVYQQLDFLDSDQIQYLLSNMKQLSEANQFQRSGLSNTNKGSNQNFGSQDRFTCEAPWWRESILFHDASMKVDLSTNNDATLHSILEQINNLRSFLSTHLDRPSLIDPALAHECYYSKSTTGAILPRHMDERHEETKGSRGWLLPSRRSISWLIYLSDEHWDVDKNGGALRAFPQHKLALPTPTGAHDGNLQIGWFQDEDQKSRPVFLDSWYKHSNSQTGNIEPHCILYYTSSSTKDSEHIYLTHPFISDSIMGETVSDYIQRQSQSPHSPTSNIFLTSNFAKGYSPLEDRVLWSQPNFNHPPNSIIQDVSPLRGSLVFFDSVSVPHEVLLVKEGTRSALAGWFHEETQPFPQDCYS